MSTTIHIGDCRDVLPALQADSIHAVVTSPPYFQLRSYLPADHPQKAREIGSEETLQAFTATMVGVFREVRRVLRPDGVCWVNLGDSYAGGGRGGGGGSYMAERGDSSWKAKSAVNGWRSTPGMKSKNLLGVPWRVAFALQEDGWILRSECIWSKTNPQPEPARDRPARSHEHVFLFSRSERYFYDPFAVLEPVAGTAKPRGNGVNPRARERGEVPGARQNSSFSAAVSGLVDKRNLRSVWSMATQPVAESNYATFPDTLARTCIKAGTSEHGACATCGAPWRRSVERVRQPGGVLTSTRTTGWAASCACGSGVVPCSVLDPFGGCGTVAKVARELGRDATLIEISELSAASARRRVDSTDPLFARVS